MATKIQELGEQLCTAVESYNIEEVQFFIEAGADVNFKKTVKTSDDDCDLTPLHFAIRLGGDGAKAYPVVKLLIDSGADMNVKGLDDWTPLMNAAFLNWPDVVKLLIKNGADTAIKKETPGQTVFQLVLDQNDADYKNILEILTQKTADGKAWLQTTAGEEWQMIHVVDLSAPLQLPPAEIQKALRVAFSDEQSEERKQVVQWVEGDGDLSWKSPNGWTLLHLAAQCGNPEMVKYLIDKGADIEAQDNLGETPLMLGCDLGYARVNMNPEAIRVLLECGANSDARDSSRRTVMDFVEEWGNFEKANQIAALIRENRAKRNHEQIDGQSSCSQNTIESRGAKKEKPAVVKKWWQFWK